MNLLLNQLSIPVEKYTLPSNGLEVILSPDHHLPLVAVNIWYHAGPLNEPPKRSGFAHLFEHLMFQGSLNVPPDGHFKLLGSYGASMINGTTSYDRTNYFETLPQEQLELALWLESDRMGFLLETLSLEKLENQRDVVMNERRETFDDEPYGPSNAAFYQNLFPKEHPYHYYVIGSMEDIAAATLDDVSDFYNHYYAPNNATLAIVGDIDIAKTKELVAKYFGGLKARNVPAPRVIPPVKLNQEIRQDIYEPVNLPRLSMAWLSAKAYTREDAAADLLALILGGGRSSRLYQKLVYEREIAQDISVQQESLALQSIFSLMILGKPDTSLDTLEQAVQEIISDLQEHGVTPEEIKRARNFLLTSHINGLQQVGAKADALNRYNQYVKEPNYFKADLARYDDLTPQELQELAKRLLKNNERVVIRTLPREANKAGVEN